MNYSKVHIQTIDAGWLLHSGLSLDILRLDKIHPIVSGNKWFKLKYYLQEAVKQQQTVVTFGGAYSNHIVAIAWCCQQAGLKSFGIIRGEKPAILSATLRSAIEYGMELQFVTREAYREMNREQRIMNNGQRIVNNEKQENNNKKRETRSNFYLINEGGYGSLGAKGAADIGLQYDLSAYTHIIAAVGTGTMLAGLVLSSLPGQKIIGISAMKGNENLENEVSALLKDKKFLTDFTILHDYHLGGFGKHPQRLFDFINEVYQQLQLPLDIVYTGKVFFAVKDLAEKNIFLMVHDY